MVPIAHSWPELVYILKPAGIPHNSRDSGQETHKDLASIAQNNWPYST